MSLALADLAVRLGARVAGQVGNPLVTGLAPPDVATAEEVSFLAPGTAPRALDDCAALVVLDHDFRGRPNTLVVDDVLRACARSAAWLPPRRRASWRADRAARVADSARLAADVTLGAGVTIGEHTRIAAHAVIEAGVSIGDHCDIGVGVVLRNHASIGNRVRIGSYCCIGDDGLVFLRDGQVWLAMPAFGSVDIDDDTTLLSHGVVQAGVFGDTHVGRGCILDSQVLIGHDSVVGAHTAIAGQTAVAGAARIGRGCRIGGKVGIGEGVTIADDVTVTAMSMVARSLERTGASYSSGWPAEASVGWWRRVAWLRRHSS